MGGLSLFAIKGPIQIRLFHFAFFFLMLGGTESPGHIFFQTAKMMSICESEENITMMRTNYH